MGLTDYTLTLIGKRSFIHLYYFIDTNNRSILSINKVKFVSKTFI